MCGGAGAGMSRGQRFENAHIWHRVRHIFAYRLWCTTTVNPRRAAQPPTCRGRGRSGRAGPRGCPDCHGRPHGEFAGHDGRVLPGAHIFQNGMDGRWKPLAKRTGDASTLAGSRWSGGLPGRSLFFSTQPSWPWAGIYGSIARQVSPARPAAGPVLPAPCPPPRRRETTRSVIETTERARPCRNE